jgi:hypothetical protein
VELLGYLSITAAWLLHALRFVVFFEIMFYGYAFATLISIGAILLEEMTYRRYNRWRHVAKLILYCFIEHFPYRQMNMWWRLQGMWQYFKGDMEWKEAKRIGITCAPAQQKPAAAHHLD